MNQNTDMYIMQDMYYPMMLNIWYKTSKWYLCNIARMLSSKLKCKMAIFTLTSQLYFYRVSKFSDRCLNILWTFVVWQKNQMTLSVPTPHKNQRTKIQIHNDNVF